MEKLPIPNLTRGEKTQTRVSGNEGDDEQLFIPLEGGIEGRSGEAHSGVGGEVVQPDIHGAKEKRKVEKNSGLQSSKRGSAGNTLQDGFPGDSSGTPGGERLDDHSGYIECIQGCQSGRTVQPSPVLQLSKSMLRLCSDAIWSERCAQSIHEDNEKGSVIYQRRGESEASNIPGRHASHAQRQGSFEIDLTGDSPVPEESKLDTVGRETEVGTRRRVEFLGWLLNSEKMEVMLQERK
ncbi:uncharacterized protein MONOS_16342 [Monocercomonoides exilis]|uniref:uncharacterized protein n=1 Tax=Monocercomonoides exilis TaxID=2049356 RepID=UPI003559908A|nr:hypothetical protein MONOS_16342 [Monocercomonoides exilis]|eukprot:MONOS_16342.1-p1 / transcript=MONOS_16342.1 / gene=MONOS_16342 / organism=Monocercomonoides_exilis_PA203 / gene_product=unspecified product / transcript_product=unspecified product / location=Mono_scaffold01662:2945-3655(-) / protein_length=237 / sequence_SO=supercontig / SO=protein_coding / is_pseudo=false